MANASSAHVAQWNGVRDWLAAIADSQGDLARFLEDVFARLNGLLSEFVGRQETWEMDRSREEQQLRARTDESARREAEWRAERERVQAESADQSPSPAVSEGDAQRLSRAIAELAEARDALLQEAKQWSSAVAPAARTESHQGLQEEMRRKEKELAGLEQERATLERELEIVRCRAAELSETLAQQGRQMGEERERWSDELKRMRRLLETMAQRELSEPAAGPRAPIAAVTMPAGVQKASAGETHGDPVLDSVITQFEMLQKDLARRRKVAAG